MLSTQKQTSLIDSKSALLDEKQVNFVFSILSNKKLIPPRFIKKNKQLPYNILFDKNHIYVISDVQLGKGGNGTIWAAQEIFKDKASHWIALKESLAKDEYFQMALSLRDDENAFWRDHIDTLRIMYYQLHPTEDAYAVSNEKLLACFKSILDPVKDYTLKMAKENAKVIENLKNEECNVFTSDNFVYSVMPLIRGKDLFDLSSVEDEDKKIDVFDIVRADALNNENAKLKWGGFLYNYARMLRDVLMEVDHLHKKNYLHRDIKPNNFMLDTTGTVRLIDFDTAAEMDKDGNCKGNINTIGSEGYQSPESLLYESKGAEQEYNFTVADDLYSLGVTLKNLYYKELLLSIKALPAEFPTAHLEDLIESIDGLTDIKPENRPKAFNYLTANFIFLVDILNIENGLLLQHSDKIENIITQIENYRMLIKSPAGQYRVNLNIDGVDFSESFTRQLLTSDIPTEVIANNLLNIKNTYFSIVKLHASNENLNLDYNFIVKNQKINIITDIYELDEKVNSEPESSLTRHSIQDLKLFAPTQELTSLEYLKPYIIDPEFKNQIKKLMQLDLQLIKNLSSAYPLLKSKYLTVDEACKLTFEQKNAIDSVFNNKHNYIPGGKEITNDRINEAVRELYLIERREFKKK